MANMGPTWVLSSPGGPHIGPMNLTIRVCIQHCITVARAEHQSEFKRHFIVTGELWGVYSEDFRNNWPFNNGTVLYNTNHSISILHGLIEATNGLDDTIMLILFIISEIIFMHNIYITTATTITNEMTLPIEKSRHKLQICTDNCTKI